MNKLKNIIFGVCIEIRQISTYGPDEEVLREVEWGGDTYRCTSKVQCMNILYCSVTDRVHFLNSKIPVSASAIVGQQNN